MLYRLRLTKHRLFIFLIIFFGIHIVDFCIVLVLGGFWDAPLSVGLPFGFYTYSCGMLNEECTPGLVYYAVFIDIVIWYILSTFILPNQKEDYLP